MKVELAEINSTCMLLSWVPSTEVTGVTQQYLVSISSGPQRNRNITINYSQLKASYLVTGLTQGQPISAKVMVKNFQTDYGPWSSEVIGTPKPTSKCEIPLRSLTNWHKV